MQWFLWFWQVAAGLIGVLSVLWMIGAGILLVLRDRAWEDLAQSSRIPRLQLFELHDQPWYPAFLRGALTEWLRALWGYSQAATVIAPILLRVIQESGSRQIIDLCSGGTGPMVPIQRELEDCGVRVPILATDKFPDATLMAALSKKTGGRITGRLEALDATQLPDGLTGLRTLFNSFHHFGPELARQILGDAYRKRQPIAVFEVTDRAAKKVALSFPVSFIGVFLLLFKMRPSRASWWFLTWIVPVLPLSIGWDGLVSHLRTYTEVELSNLVRGMDRNYSWEIGRVDAPRPGVRIGYIIGCPDKEGFLV